jgi:hypothetical protein
MVCPSKLWTPWNSPAAYLSGCWTELCLDTKISATNTVSHKTYHNFTNVSLASRQCCKLNCRLVNFNKQTTYCQHLRHSNSAMMFKNVRHPSMSCGREGEELGTATGYGNPLWRHHLKLVRWSTHWQASHCDGHIRNRVSDPVSYPSIMHFNKILFRQIKILIRNFDIESKIFQAKVSNVKAAILDTDVTYFRPNLRIKHVARVTLVLFMDLAV